MNDDGSLTGADHLWSDLIVKVRLAQINQSSTGLSSTAEMLGQHECV